MTRSITPIFMHWWTMCFIVSNLALNTFLINIQINSKQFIYCNPYSKKKLLINFFSKKVFVSSHQRVFENRGNWYGVLVAVWMCANDNRMQICPTECKGNLIFRQIKTIFVPHVPQILYVSRQIIIHLNKFSR